MNRRASRLSGCARNYDRGASESNADVRRGDRRLPIAACGFAEGGLVCCTRTRARAYECPSDLAKPQADHRDRGGGYFLTFASFLGFLGFQSLASEIMRLTPAASFSMSRDPPPSSVSLPLPPCSVSQPAPPNSRS